MLLTQEVSSYVRFIIMSPCGGTTGTSRSIARLVLPSGWAQTVLGLSYGARKQNIELY